MQTISKMTYDECVEFLMGEDRRKLWDDFYFHRWYNSFIYKIKDHIMIELNNKDFILLSKNSFDVFFDLQDFESSYRVNLANVFLPKSDKLSFNEWSQIVLTRENGEKYTINTRLSIKDGIVYNE